MENGEGLFVQGKTNKSDGKKIEIRKEQDKALEFKVFLMS